MWGDLGVLSSSLDAVRADLDGVDVAGAGVAASAMPLAGAVYLFDGVLMGAGDGRYLARTGILTLVPYLPLAIIVAKGAPALTASTTPAIAGTGRLVWLWMAFAWVFMGMRALTTGLRARGSAWRR